MRKKIFLITLFIWTGCLSDDPRTVSTVPPVTTSVDEPFIKIYRLGDQIYIYLKKINKKSLSAQDKKQIEKELRELSPEDNRILIYWLALKYPPKVISPQKHNRI